MALQFFQILQDVGSIRQNGEGKCSKYKTFSIRVKSVKSEEFRR